MTDECLFCRIAGGQLPAELVREDDALVAFRDINPQAPTHILIVPRDHIVSAAELRRTDGDLLGRIFVMAADVADEEGLTEGWRLVTNVGPDAGQSVRHLHFHLLGGRTMRWPPG